MNEEQKSKTSKKKKKTKKRGFLSQMNKPEETEEIQQAP